MYAEPLAGVMSDILISPHFGHVFVICANALLILRVYLIHSQEVITMLSLFVYRWYLLNTVAVVLVTTYLTLMMVADRMSADK